MLRCIIQGAIEPVSYIIWYHGNQQLLPDNKHGFRMQIGKASNGGLNGNGVANGIADENNLELDGTLSSEFNAPVDKENTVSN